MTESTDAADDGHDDGQAALDAAAVQDIRLAVVLNGGVSLAIWISGVAHELNALVQASRRRGTAKPTDDAYADLLDVLKANARIDVIAGTSAGGINGGFLSLGLVHGCDLSGLRTLWQKQGDLGTLLRNPREANAPSLLRGEYFHQQLTQAYDEVWKENTGARATDDEDVDLFLTGTLWEGRRSFFADDMGRHITELDHDATFHFTSDPEIVTATAESADPGDLCSPSVTAALGRASRCTASFPGAFEPFFVSVPKETAQLADGRWSSDAGRANFLRPQYVIDGGILRNKPIRPAIDAVYRQPADVQVRRILTYVVPDPGEAPTGSGDTTVTAVPGAIDVVLGVMTRLRSTDSVAEELAEIRRRNEETAQRRRARDQLAQALVDAARPDTGAGVDLVRSAWPGYLEIRRDDTAQSVARLLLSAPGQPPWSQREVAAELHELATTQNRDVLPFIPQKDPTAAFRAAGDEWRWGQATVRRLGDLVLDVLKRAVWLAPLSGADRQTIVEQRAATHVVLRGIRQVRRELDAYWRRPKVTAGMRSEDHSQLPARDDRIAATPLELHALRGKLAELAAHWSAATGTTSAMRTLHEQARELARCLHAAGPSLRAISTSAPAVLDKDGAERERLRALVRLLVPEEAENADAVLGNMLRLEVVHVAFTGVSDVPEQAVELVQISSLQKELVTGVQLNHFGAFYRESWRANDWLRGRLDGSEQLVQTLLAPERLRQIYDKDWRGALTALRGVAVGRKTDRHFAELSASWDACADELSTEMQVLEKDEPLPRTFPQVAQQISYRIRTEFLMKELGSLADAAVDEPDAVADAGKWGDDVRKRLRPHEHDGTEPTASELEKLLEQSAAKVGMQTITAEAARGSDTFARTASHAAAAMTSTAASVKKPKTAVTLLKAVRGYALLVWTLVEYLAGGSKVGRAAASLAVGVGGALIAVSLLVPGIPSAVPLTGVVLVLAALSAAAVRRGQLVGRRFALRVIVLLVVAAAALAWLIWEASDRSWHKLWDTLSTVGLRILPVAAVLIVGWFLARPIGPRNRR